MGIEGDPGQRGPVGHKGARGLMGPMGLMGFEGDKVGVHACMYMLTYVCVYIHTYNINGV